jgi:hypothetical protein
MNLPRRIPKAPKRTDRIRCPAHLKFVRSFACSIPGCNGRPIEAAHIRLGAHAGMSQKPDDSRAISLCTDHHRQAHNKGEETFAAMYQLDYDKLITHFVSRSPHRQKLQVRP